MQNNHRLLALSHQLKFMVDQFRDHGVLRVSRAQCAHVLLAHDVVQRVLVGVEELIHVASDRIPQVQMHAQNHRVAVLRLSRAQRDAPQATGRSDRSSGASAS